MEQQADENVFFVGLHHNGAGCVARIGDGAMKVRLGSFKVFQPDANDTGVVQKSKRILDFQPLARKQRRKGFAA